MFWIPEYSCLKTPEQSPYFNSFRSTKFIIFNETSTMWNTFYIHQEKIMKIYTIVRSFEIVPQKVLWSVWGSHQTL